MKHSAISGFRALANELRLAIFRLLVKAGPKGLAAGRIASELDVPSSTLSSHLSQLEQADLLMSWREQQKILYAVNMEGTQELMRFLLEDCCDGNAELCGVTIKKTGNVSRTKSLKTS